MIVVPRLKTRTRKEYTGTEPSATKSGEAPGAVRRATRDRGLLSRTPEEEVDKKVKGDRSKREVSVVMTRKRPGPQGGLCRTREGAALGRQLSHGLPHIEQLDAVGPGTHHTVTLSLWIVLFINSK